MNKQVLFDGKVTLGNQLVDFRIYKNEGRDIVTYYSFDVNPEVKDVTQADYHNGETKRAEDLATLLFRFNEFQQEFTQIDAMRFNVNF